VKCVCEKQKIAENRVKIRHASFYCRAASEGRFTGMAERLHSDQVSCIREAKVVYASDMKYRCGQGEAG